MSQKSLFFIINCFLFGLISGSIYAYPNDPWDTETYRQNTDPWDRETYRQGPFSY